MFLCVFYTVLDDKDRITLNTFEYVVKKGMMTAELRTRILSNDFEN